MADEGEDKLIRVPVQHLSEALATQRQIKPGLGKMPKRRGMLAKVKLDRRPATFRDVNEDAFVLVRDHGQCRFQDDLKPNCWSADTNRFPGSAGEFRPNGLSVAVVEEL